MKKTIAIASDHAGFALKTVLKKEISLLGYEVQDLGANSTESVDGQLYNNAVPSLWILQRISNRFYN